MQITQKSLLYTSVTGLPKAHDRRSLTWRVWQSLKREFHVGEFPALGSALITAWELRGYTGHEHLLLGAIRPLALLLRSRAVLFPGYLWPHCALEKGLLSPKKYCHSTLCLLSMLIPLPFSCSTVPYARPS